MDGVFESLLKLTAIGFKLFVVSNQPDAALNKALTKDTLLIAQHFREMLQVAGVQISEFFYCFHHPKAEKKEDQDCLCRKPKAFFAFEAARKFDLDLEKSWMIGDQDSDIEFGQNAGCKTVLVLNDKSANKRLQSSPTLTANDFSESVKKLLEYEANGENHGFT
jgi:D-glycero-D-manno-heptose 1,7-bisphosphate phosphatase